MNRLWVSAVVALLAATSLAGCFAQPPSIKAQPLVPGGFFLRVSLLDRGLDPGWINLTADFDQARLFRDFEGRVLNLEPNEPRNRGVDLVGAARSGETYTIALIYAPNEYFVGFGFDMLNLRGARHGDPEKGEPAVVPVRFHQEAVGFRAPHPVLIFADNRPVRLPDGTNAPYSHIVETTVVLDLGESLGLAPDGTMTFVPKLANVIFKVDGRVAANLANPRTGGPNDPHGTFQSPVARGAAYLDDHLYAWPGKPVARVLGDPVPPGAEVQFTGRGSVDRDFYGRIARYVWDFGDGTPPAAGSRHERAYERGGLYDPTLTVMDDDGNTDSVTFPLLVAWGLDEALPGDHETVADRLVNLRHPTTNASLAGQASHTHDFAFADLEGERPYRPGLYVLDLAWDDDDADLHLFAHSGSVVGAAEATGPTSKRLVLQGAPYVLSTLQARVEIVAGATAAYQLNATIHHVPDIEVGWDGHLDHVHPRYVGMFPG